MKKNKKRPAKKGPLTAVDITSMVEKHEGGNTIYELAEQFGVKPRSVAAYVANAHR